MMELTNALSMEGYLQKQAPNVFKKFQKRYFAVRSEGQYIVWFKKKPSSAQQNPQGIILIDEVKQIIAKQSDQRIFKILYKEREFILRAEKLEVRDRWVKYLQIIVEYHKKMNKNKKKVQENKLQSWKWKVVDQQTSNKIRIQNQKILLSQGTIDVAQKSLNFLLQNVKFGNVFEHQKYVIHGFHKQKSFISQNQYWHFICSQFNLHQEKDQNMDQTIKDHLQNIGKNLQTSRKKKKKQQSSSEESESSQEQISKIQPTFTINKLFIFSCEDKKLVQTITMEEIVSWQQDIQSGYKLIIKYLPFQNAQFDISQDDKQKQYIIQSDFLYEIKKLAKGIKIIYEKYSIKKTRQQMMNKRFERFQMKGYKLNDSDWKIFENKTFVLLNLEAINIQGTNYSLSDIIGQINKESCSDLPGESGEKQGQQSQKKKNDKKLPNYLQFHTKEAKVKVVMSSEQAQKNLFKKFTKLLKKIRKKKQSQKKVIKAVNSVQQQQSMKTYFLDKKLRQTSNSIKTNYYELMNRQVPKKAVQTQDTSFLGKIMKMFCGGFKDDQLGI